MSRTIEDIHRIFRNIRLADLSENRWFTEPLTEIDNPRVLISRGPNGEYCVFIKGSLQSFGRYPYFSGMEHRENVLDSGTDQSFQGLRIIAPDFPNANEAIAHIAYVLEKLLIEEPELDNTALIFRISWILGILGSADAPMTNEGQRGLVAECFFLTELLERARVNDISPERALETWVTGRRDFAGNAIAVEVKSTSHVTRRHHISSLDQLTVEPNEQVFIYSVGLRHDASGSNHLTDYIDRVSQFLIGSDGHPLPGANNQFQEKLRGHGYYSSHRGNYISGDAIMLNTNLPPRLFSVQNLDRLSIDNFKEEELPPGIVNVSYDLEISSEPISDNEKFGIFDTLLGLY